MRMNVAICLPQYFGLRSFSRSFVCFVVPYILDHERHDKNWLPTFSPPELR
jgi:hypothetical protein